MWLYANSLAAVAVLSAQVNVLTWHNDNARTGQNLNETILTPANVASQTFGKLAVLSVDGKVDAQPLYVQNVAIPGQGVHNVLYVATEHGSLYAFDADTFAQLRQVSLIGANETPSDDHGCGQVTPEIGITATPAIDLQAGPAGTIFAIAQSVDASRHYHNRLHALDLPTLTEQLSGPVEIQATFPGSGAENTFDPSVHVERPGLLIFNGMVYTSWGSHCDAGSYAGWVLSYSETTLQRVGVLNLIPNGNDGGIWAAGSGPAVDAGGNLFLLTGNGTFDVALNSSGFPSQSDYGNAFVKMSTSGPLAVVDYFTMTDTTSESNADVDLGSGGLMLLPALDNGQGTAVSLVVGAGKDTNIYVLDQTNLGKFNPRMDSIYQLMSNALPEGAWSSPAWFNGKLYYGGVGDSLKAFAFTSGRFSLAAQSAHTFPYPGTTPSISANGTANGIVWTAENRNPAVLHAFDATNVATELYHSNQAARGRDHFGEGNKFIVPTVANGKVYVGTTNGVGVFGPLTTQYQLTISASPVAGGTVSPATGGLYNAGTSVPITATPAAGYAFTNWTGNVANASSASTTVTMSAAETVVANFSAATSITIQTSPEGLQFSVDGGAAQTAPQTLGLSPGSHMIAVAPTQAGPAGAPAGTQDVFASWSDDGAASHNITVGSSASTFTATFQTQYQLTISASPAAGGTVSPASGGFYNAGTAVPITATPAAGYAFSNWTFGVAASTSASTTVTMSAPQAVAAVFTIVTNSSGLGFFPVTPCRVMDTRNANGIFGGPIVPSGGTRDVPIPQSACNIPSTAQAYSLNITAVPPGPAGTPLDYLTVWPAGQAQPLVSTLNSLDARVVANAAIVPAGSNSAISVYVSDTSHVIIDVNGYFAPISTSGSLAFYSLRPCRVVDTRLATAPFGGPSLSGGSTRSFAIPSSPCGVPSGVQAYSLNFTVVPHGPLGYLSTWPAGQTQPVVSTLNSYDGSVVANAAIVPAGTGSAIDVFATDATDVVIDINGYFAPPGSAGALSFYPLTPCRVADTRTGSSFADGFGAPALAGNAARDFAIASSGCGVPAAAQAYALNMTVVPPGPVGAPLGYLSAWPAGQTQPLVSTLNDAGGLILANAAIVQAGTSSGGPISVFVSDPTNLVIDINGYFGQYERQHAERARSESHSLLFATLEATDDGILVVDRGLQVVGQNQRFLELWRIPPELAATRDDARLIEFVSGQLADPPAFLRSIHATYASPERETHDVQRESDPRIPGIYRLDASLEGAQRSRRFDHTAADAHSDSGFDASRGSDGNGGHASAGFANFIDVTASSTVQPFFLLPAGSCKLSLTIANQTTGVKTTDAIDFSVR